MNRSQFAYALLLLLAGILSGCRSGEGPAEFLYREADVVTVDVRLTDTVPTRVDAIVRGTLCESCATLDEIRQEYVESTSTFVLTLTTRRPVDEPCIQDATAFEATVPLAIERLSAGVYTVVANGITASFRLTPEDLPPIR